MKENKKNIIFCLSYLSVPWTLQIIEDKGYKNCLIITNIESIEKLFVELYNSEIVYSTKKSGRYILFFSEFNPFKIIVKFFLNIYYVTKERRIFKNVSGKNIFFFFTAFGIFESYLINQLSKKNNIFYLPDVKMDTFDIDNSVKSNINFFFIKSLYKIDVNTLKNGPVKVFAVSNKFLRNINANSFQLPYNLSKVKNKIQEYYNLGKFKILLLSGNYIDAHLVSDEEFIRKNDELITFLIKKFGKNSIAIKLHPRFSQKYSKEFSLIEIDKHLPGNLMLDNFDIIIGYTSSLLYEAANYGILTISTLNYFAPVNILKKKKYLEYLKVNTNNNMNINYFTSLDQLNNIIINCKIKNDIKKN